MPGPRGESAVVDAVSVGDLVRMRAGLTADAWKLALVQRDEAWDEHKVARLLDSILAGYPIGTLLLCRTRERSAVLDLGRPALRAVLDDGSWQILDGQQRILALSSLFHGDATAGSQAPPTRFFLNLSADRVALDPGKKDKRTSRLIVWQTAEHDPFEESGKGRSLARAEWLSLSRLGRWLIEHGDQAPEVESLGAAELAGWLGKVDEEFGSIRPDAGARARGRAVRLVERWRTRWLPVLKVELQGPDDVLQVFSRVNLEGVRTSAADIFFAGVKTEWRQAEEALQGLCDRAPFLGRLDALRLVARLASYELGGNDIVPLALERLRGDQGGRIVRSMERIATAPRVRRRLEEVATYLVKGSGLGHALLLADRHLVDHGLGWALAHPDGAAAELERIAGYLFWGSAFRLHPVLRDEVSRLAMAESVAASASAFPVEAILRAVRARWPELGYRRSSLARPFGPNGRRDCEGARDAVNQRAHLFLALGQGLPFDLSEGRSPRSLDWDHVYPRAGRGRIKWRGADGTWKLQLHRPGTRLLKRAGNLCALASSTNRHLQDLPPRKKLERVEAMEREGSLWPRSLFLDDEDRRLLRRFDELLDEGRVPEAVQVFDAFVSRREQRLWDHAVRTIPGLELFRDNLFAE